ncbi:MAG: hypothetical protein ACI4KR_10335 [Ruminiclostridium sp.]
MITSELNKLTQGLFAQGYSEDNYPDYVRPFNKFYGGFEYTYEYQQKMLFSTPCGLHVRGDYFVGGGMSYMGVDWTIENDNPVIHCPYKKSDCTLRSSLLPAVSGVGSCKACFCNCHKINGDYDYEKSVDKILNLENQKRERKFEDFSEKKKGRACSFMCRYNEWTEEWCQVYNPIECVNYGCSYCSILKWEISNVKGNVFYDVVLRYRVEQGEGFFYENKIKTQMIKGKKLFSRNAPLDICKIIARTQKKHIISRERSRYSKELFFAEYHGKFFEVEVVNIRAERRETRDLLSDLRDISDGIIVLHNSDIEADAKEHKKENARKSIESKKRKYLRLLAEKPLNEIDVIYRRRIEKYLDKGIITFEELRMARKAKEEEYEQITFESEVGENENQFMA